MTDVSTAPLDAILHGYQTRTGGIDVDDVRTLAQGLVLTPFTSTTVIDFSGKDAQRFLQTKLSCDTRKWAKEGGSYGFAVDINGRVLFDGHFATLPNGKARLWSAPGMESAIVGHFDRYIIVDDVVMTPQRDLDHFLLSAESETALWEALDLKAPDAPFQVIEAEGLRVIPVERAARPSVLLEAETATLQTLVRRLNERGARVVSWESWRAFEILEGFVRVGADLEVGVTIPLEAELEVGVHYNKGCYLGQEVIERLRSRGNASRGFRRAVIQAPAVERGATIVDEKGSDVGVVRSSLTIGQTTHAIVQLRRRVLDAPTELRLQALEGPTLTIEGAVR